MPPHASFENVGTEASRSPSLSATWACGKIFFHGGNRATRRPTNFSTNTESSVWRAPRVSSTAQLTDRPIDRTERKKT